MARGAVVSSTMEKYTSIRELELSKDPGVFILNTTPRAARADVLFSMQRQSGGEDIVKVIKTFIPQDLTTQIPKDQLLRSAQFRACVAKGLIKLLTPEYAEKLLSTEDAQEEQSRIFALQSAANTILAASAATAVNSEEEDDAPTSPTSRRRKVNQKAAEEANAEKEVQRPQGEDAFDLLLNSLTTETNPTLVLNRLRNEGSMTVKELKKDIKMLGKKFPKVGAWAQKLLAKESR